MIWKGMWNAYQILTVMFNLQREAAAVSWRPDDGRQGGWNDKIWGKLHMELNIT